MSGAGAAVLAVDGGNSKTDLALVGWGGTVLAALRGPGASQEDYGIEGAVARLGDMVRSLAARAGGQRPAGVIARHLSACLAGADLPEEEAALGSALAALGWSRSATVMNDTLAVLRAGTDKRGGAAVTCGAGINCVAVAPDGRTVRYLARGRLTGDWGGGLGLGEAVLWHAMRGWDGRGPATVLGDAVAACFGLDSVRAVAVAVDRGDIGGAGLLRLSPVLFRVAADGDAVARSLVRRQAAEIAVMAGAALGRLEVAPAGLPVVLGGGLIEGGGPLLLAEIERELTAAAPGAVARVLDVPPVAGAALLGLDQVGAPAAAGRRLRAHYRPG